MVSGLRTLPPVKVLVFATSTFGLVAALIDWALFQKLFPSAGAKPERLELGGGRPQNAGGKGPPQTPAPQTDSSLIERARRHSIVFREICPPPAKSPLSFYGGVPIGPAGLAWPRVRNKPGDAPLSFIMQWDCAGLAVQDVTGLLPRDGVLYLFADLAWGEPFDFQFVHAPGPADGWQTLPVPPGLPPLYGEEGAHQVPYCSPLIAKESQDVPCVLPKWPFTPMAFFYPASPGDPDAAAPGTDREGWFWNDGEATAEALLLLQHPEGVPAATRLDKPKPRFGRPFAAFPHDYAAVRVVAAKVLDQLRRPPTWLLRGTGEPEREAKFQLWRDEAGQRYRFAAEHRPAARIAQSLSDEMWQWMEGLEPVLGLGWHSVVEECVNVTLGLGSEAVGALPADLVSVCADRHRLALAYLHDEYPDRRKPEAQAAWEARKAEGSLKEVRSVQAACPNHIFGPPSFVQGYAEEHLEERVLLLELSSRRPIGHEFGEGVLQFMIRPSDLRDGRFDRTMLIASAY